MRSIISFKTSYLLMLTLLTVSQLRSQYVFGDREVAVMVLGGATSANYDEYNKVLQANGFAELNSWSASAGIEGVIPLNRVFINIGMIGSSQEHSTGDDKHLRWKVNNINASVGYDLMKSGSLSIVPFLGLGGQFENLKLNGTGQLINPDGTTYDYEVDGTSKISGISGHMGLGTFYRVNLKPKGPSLLLGVQARYANILDSTVKEDHYSSGAWLSSLDFRGSHVDGMLTLSAMVGLSF